MRDLQSLLDEIRKGGNVDSAGEFTLDHFSAVRKLARAQFPSPYLYALKLVQWAIASHADAVVIRLGFNSLEVEHDGHPVGGALKELARWALASPTGEQRRLVHLASAMLALQTLQPSRIELRSAGRRLVVAGGKDVVESSDEGTERIRISGLPAAPQIANPASLFTMASALAPFTLTRPEVALLFTRCAFSEIPIWLNGIPLSRPLLGQRQFTPRMVKGKIRHYISPGLYNPLRVALAPAGEVAAITVPGPEVGSIFPLARFWIRSQPGSFQEIGVRAHRVDAPISAVELRRITLGDFPMYRGWAILMDYTARLETRLTAGFRSHRLLLVQDGVVVEGLPLKREQLYAEGVVATGTLPLDLSHFRFVRGEPFKQRLDEVFAFLDQARQ